MRFIVFALVQSPDGAADTERLPQRDRPAWSTPRSSASDAVWMAEHHFHNYCITARSPCSSRPTSPARTKRIRIGTAANVLPLSHPVRIAEQTAMLDILSEGRLDVGFAKGYGPREFMGYGVDQRQSEERFREALEIIFAAWTQDEFSYKGRHFTIPKASLRPRPRTKPHPSAYVATTGSQPTIDLAAKTRPPLLRRLPGTQALRRDQGTLPRPPPRPTATTTRPSTPPLERAAVMQTSYLAPTNEESYAEAKPVVAHFSGNDRFGQLPHRPRHLAPRSPGARPRELPAPRRAGATRTTTATGTPSSTANPERGVERVRHLQASGFRNVLIGFSFGGDALRPRPPLHGALRRKGDARAFR